MNDESLIGQRLNAIMGIYDRQNGTLIKLSSFPDGFILNNTNGTTQLATTLRDPKIQNISAIVTLTNGDKTERYTNDVRAGNTSSFKYDSDNIFLLPIFNLSNILG